MIGACTLYISELPNSSKFPFTSAKIQCICMSSSTYWSAFPSTGSFTTLSRYVNISLQVTLVEPVIGKVKSGVPPPNPHLSPQNNVEWRLELGPNESRSVTIQYTVEFPVNKEVEGLWTEQQPLYWLVFLVDKFLNFDSNQDEQIIYSYRSDIVKDSQHNNMERPFMINHMPV